MVLPRRSKSFLVVLGVLGSLVAGGLWALRPPADPPGAGPTVTVVIPEGTGASQIAEILERHGVIRSAFVFKVLARLDGRGARIQAGTYELARGARTDEVLAQLAAGPPPPPTFTVTIPEGLTVAQTLERIASAPGSPFEVAELREALRGVAIPAWVPVMSLPEDAEPFEGLLFPDTYEFRLDASAQDVIARLVAETDEVVAAMPAGETGLAPYEMLTLASLIEREARLPEEQPRISSVIHNRLEKGRLLQIDASVLYALREQKDTVLRVDLEVDSPWNTYRNAGLPPTPISGVGQAAIRAAADPADEEYLYYVVEDPATGRHRFSRTFSEHQQAIAAIRHGNG